MATPLANIFRVCACCCDYCCCCIEYMLVLVLTLLLLLPQGNVVTLLAKKALPSLDLPKLRRNAHIEILPLSTGCLGACTYCKTKHARGQLGSYAPEELVSRAAAAAADPRVREIWLSSEDTGAYGESLGRGRSLD